MKFEWDDEKNIINYRKHKIHFETSAYVFSDSNRIEIYDKNHSDYEDRYVTIGFYREVLLVVYTIRNEQVRIISARKATGKEIELYYGNCKKDY